MKMSNELLKLFKVDEPQNELEKMQEKFQKKQITADELANYIQGQLVVA